MSAQISPQIQDFNKTRAAFMQRASAPHVPPIAFKLAYLIAFKYLNRKTGTTFVAQDTLARDLKLSDRHVRRLLDILRPLGLGIAPGDGRGKASTYWLDPVTATGAERRTPMSTFTDQKVDKKGGHLASKKVDSHVRPTLLKRTKKNPSGKCYAFPQKDGERSRVRAKENPLGGDPAADAAPRQERPARKQARPARKQASKNGMREEGYARETTAATATAGREPESKQEVVGDRALRELRKDGDGDAFGALRVIWQRGHASDDSPKAIAIAHAAFAKACREAEPGEIIAAAKTWVAAADAPRFLPALATWLAAVGWTKPPPTKPKRQRNSNGRHRDNLPRTNGNKVDLGKLSFMSAGYQEDEDGNLHHPDGDKGSCLTWRMGQ
jgi:hypothetical protein